MTTDVLLVDEHQLVVAGIAALVEAETDLTVVGCAGTADKALTMATEDTPDVIVTDSQLPDGDGIDVSRQIGSVAPDAHFVMMTSSREAPTVGDALDAGIDGFADRSADVADFLAAVRSAAKGQVHFSPDAQQQLIGAYRVARHPAHVLTKRELEVLRAIAASHGTGEIAATLSISQHTVRNHVRHIFTKLDVHSKLEAVFVAVNAGLIVLNQAGTGASANSVSSSGPGPTSRP